MFGGKIVHISRERLQSSCGEFWWIMRSRGYDKRGGAAVKIALYDALLVLDEHSVDLLDLGRALSLLKQVDRRKSMVVELRFFGGLTLQETAEVLSVSENTVSNDWNFAKTWLLWEMMQPF